MPSSRCCKRLTFHSRTVTDRPFVIATVTDRRPWNIKYLQQVSAVAYCLCPPFTACAFLTPLVSLAPLLPSLTLSSCLPPLVRLLLLLTLFLVDMESTAATADQRCAATYPRRRARRHAYCGRGRGGRWR